MPVEFDRNYKNMQTARLEKSTNYHRTSDKEDNKTFSPTTTTSLANNHNNAGSSSRNNGASQFQLRASRHRRRTNGQLPSSGIRRPPSYHRFSAAVAGQRIGITNSVLPIDDFRPFVRPNSNTPEEAMYYSDADSPSYYYIEQALPYEQWKQMILRRGSSLGEVCSVPSLSSATEWLV